MSHKSNTAKAERRIKSAFYGMKKENGNETGEREKTTINGTTACPSFTTSSNWKHAKNFSFVLREATKHCEALKIASHQTLLA